MKKPKLQKELQKAKEKFMQNWTAGWWSYSTKRRMRDDLNNLAQLAASLRVTTKD